jgi:hypothetical protein
MNLSQARLLAVTLVALVVSGCGHRTASQSEPVDRRVAVLNQLRDEINSCYGYTNGTPRINRGPCGRFAKAFREKWNARFNEKVNIAFVMETHSSLCVHVVVKFPDGRYFDGGNGVISAQELLRMCPHCRIDEMIDFDLNLLNQRCDNLLNRRCDGLDYVYPICPKYTDDLTASLIENHLTLLTNGIDVHK